MLKWAVVIWGRGGGGHIYFSCEGEGVTDRRGSSTSMELSARPSGHEEEEEEEEEETPAGELKSISQT